MRTPSVAPKAEPPPARAGRSSARSTRASPIQPPSSGRLRGPARASAPTAAAERTVTRSLAAAGGSTAHSATRRGPAPQRAASAQAALTRRPPQTTRAPSARLGLAEELPRGPDRGGACVAERGRGRQVGREAAVEDPLGFLAPPGPSPATRRPRFDSPRPRSAGRRPGWRCRCCGARRRCRAGRGRGGSSGRGRTRIEAEQNSDGFSIERTAVPRRVEAVGQVLAQEVVGLLPPVAGGLEEELGAPSP